VLHPFAFFASEGPELRSRAIQGLFTTLFSYFDTMQAIAVHKRESGCASAPLPLDPENSRF